LRNFLFSLGIHRPVFGLDKGELMGFDEAIGLDEEFAHEGDQGDFARFASLAEAVVEAGEERMVLGGDQSGHVEGFADGGSAAPDFSPAAPLAAVAVEGGQAGQGGDLASVQLPQLGQVSHQLEGRIPSDSGDGLEDSDGLTERLGLLEEEADLVVQLVQKLIEGLEEGVDLLANEVGGGIAQPTTLPMDLLQELISSLDQFDQLPVLWGEGFLGSRMEGRSVLGEDFGIDSVGFGGAAFGAGEVTELARVDAGERDLGLMEGIHQGLFVPSGGLQDDMEGVREGTKPLEELLSAFRSIGESAKVGLRGGRHIHIELLGSHIDSDVDGCLLCFHSSSIGSALVSEHSRAEAAAGSSNTSKGSFSGEGRGERNLATRGRSFWTEARGGCDHVPARLGRGYPRPKPFPPPEKNLFPLTTPLS